MLSVASLTSWRGNPRRWEMAIGGGLRRPALDADRIVDVKIKTKIAGGGTRSYLRRCTG